MKRACVRLAAVLAFSVVACLPSFAAAQSQPQLALTPEQYTTFVELVLDYFESRAMNVQLADSVVRYLDPEGNEKAFGLDNLASTCAQAPQGEWRAIIKAHFDAALRLPSEAEYVESLIAHYGRVAEYLCLRIFPGDFFGGMDSSHLVL